MSTSGTYKVISADTHIIEPPDIYASRIEPRLKDRAPRVERRKNNQGQVYDAWFLDGLQIRQVGHFAQAGKRFDNASQVDLGIGLWEEVTKAAYDPHEMIKDLETDGVQAACLQPSLGLAWYRMPDSDLLSGICRAYNDWIADFCDPYPDRLKGVGCLNVDDVEEGCRELERCAKLGLAAAFIPVYPLPEAPYRHPIYERLWWTAQDLDIPLLLHVGSMRGGIPGCEEKINLGVAPPAAIATNEHWVKYSMTDMVFAGIFDRHPGLKIGAVEHEMAWIPHWLKQMDFIYMHRPGFTKGWKSTKGSLPSDCWRSNMFVEFMEDDIGVQHRDIIGTDNMLWGNDFPHAESTWPQSMAFLDRIFANIPQEDRRKITSENAVDLFGFPAE